MMFKQQLPCCCTGYSQATAKRWDDAMPCAVVRPPYLGTRCMPAPGSAVKAVALKS